MGRHLGMGSAPYSPGTPPCDFHVFKLLLEHLKGIKVKTAETEEVNVLECLHTYANYVLAPGMNEILH